MMVRTGLWGKVEGCRTKLHIYVHLAINYSEIDLPDLT